jgi:hypothetical protein
MPAWGLEGGGPMNDGQLNDLIDYLHSFQIDQTVELDNNRIKYQFSTAKN